jgi:chromosome segregation ATPase
LQARADLAEAESSVSTLAADKAQLQQELSAARDQVLVLESELKLKASRLEAAQEQLATEGQEHGAEMALLQKQLEQLKVSVGVRTARGERLEGLLVSCAALCWASPTHTHHHLDLQHSCMHAKPPTATG